MPPSPDLIVGKTVVANDNFHIHNFEEHIIEVPVPNMERPSSFERRSKITLVPIIQLFAYIFIPVVTVLVFIIGGIIGGIHYGEKNCSSDSIAALIILCGLFQVVAVIPQVYKTWLKGVRDGQMFQLEWKMETIRNDWRDIILFCVRIARLVVFIWTALIVYDLYSKVVYDREAEDGFEKFYCHKDLFLFSFWTLTFFFILCGITLILLICPCSCIVFWNRSFRFGRSGYDRNLLERHALCPVLIDIYYAFEACNFARI